MNRSDALPYVSYVVDDAGCGRAIGADQHAIVRPGNPAKRLDEQAPPADHCYPSVLVGWQCGFEAMFVAVHSYMDIRVAEDDAAEMATEYLEEIKWFSDPDGDHYPDYILT